MLSITNLSFGYGRKSVFDHISLSMEAGWQAVKSYLLFLIAPVGVWYVSFLKLKEQEL